MNKTILLLLLVVCKHAPLLAQAKCGFDQKMEQLKAASPESRQQIEATELFIQKYIAENAPGLQKRNTTVYTIPVVIHVMHTGGAPGSIYNPSDTRLTGFINYLNQVFGGTYPGMEAPADGGPVVNMELNFALAQRAPNCGYTNGINRVDATSLPNYVANGVSANTTNGSTDLALKNFSRWSPNDYYNIWVVNKIDGADGTAGQFIAGYAYFAGSSASLDGTVMLATQAIAGNKVLPHEIGHAFNLYHPFQGSNLNTTCPTNANCTSEGDRVCDTDPISNNVNSNGVYNFLARTGVNICTNTSYTRNTEKNFMSYTNGFTLFTNGQKQRVQAAMQLPSRINLANSLGVTPCGAVINFQRATDSRIETSTDTTQECRPYTDYNYQLTIGAAPNANATATLMLGGTATRGIDYEVTTNGNFLLPSLAMVFATGASAPQPFIIRVYNDAVIELNENITFKISLNNGGGNATVGTNIPAFSFTIISNDNAVVAAGVTTTNIGAPTFNLSQAAGDAVFNPKQQYKKVQILYKASELATNGVTAGLLTGISFNILAKKSTRPFGNLTLQMGSATVANLVDGGVSVIRNLAKVKNAFAYNTVEGFNNITFDQSYNWNGTDNLVVELCYDNGTFDATQASDSTAGYSDCGTCFTGNMFFQDGLSCSGSYTAVSYFANNIKPQIKLTKTVIGTPIATALNTTSTTSIGPFDEVFFYDAMGKVIARLKNLTSFIYGCTTITIDRAGATVSPFWNSAVSNQLLSKSVKVISANNTNSGNFQLTLYYTEAEVAAWQTATGRNWQNSLLQVCSVSGGKFMPDVTPTQPLLSQVVLAPGTKTNVGGNYSISAEFTNAGPAGYGVGVPGLAGCNLLTWTGLINNLWSNPGNWSCNQVPTPNDIILIPSGNPHLDINFTVAGKLTLNTSATLTINTGVTLTVTGISNVP